MDSSFSENRKSIENKEIATDLHLREVELIEEFTGKKIDAVLNDSTLPELMKIHAYLDFMRCM